MHLPPLEFSPNRHVSLHRDHDPWRRARYLARMGAVVLCAPNGLILLMSPSFYLPGQGITANDEAHVAEAWQHVRSFVPAELSLSCIERGSTEALRAMETMMTCKADRADFSSLMAATEKGPPSTRHVHFSQSLLLAGMDSSHPRLLCSLTHAGPALATRHNSDYTPLHRAVACTQPARLCDLF